MDIVDIPGCVRGQVGHGMDIRDGWYRSNNPTGSAQHRRGHVKDRDIAGQVIGQRSTCEPL